MSIYCHPQVSDWRCLLLSTLKIFGAQSSPNLYFRAMPPATRQSSNATEESCSDLCHPGISLQATQSDRQNWKGWCEIESEPVGAARTLVAPIAYRLVQAFFNMMLKQLGVQGVKVCEVFSFDEDMLQSLPSVPSGKSTPVSDCNHQAAGARFDLLVEVARGHSDGKPQIGRYHAESLVCQSSELRHIQACPVSKRCRQSTTHAQPLHC